jgi:DNA mismatch repair protein MSH6
MSLLNWLSKPKKEEPLASVKQECNSNSSSSSAVSTSFSSGSKRVEADAGLDGPAFLFKRKFDAIETVDSVSTSLVTPHKVPCISPAVASKSHRRVLCSDSEEEDDGPEKAATFSKASVASPMVETPLKYELQSYSCGSTLDLPPRSQSQNSTARALCESMTSSPSQSSSTVSWVRAGAAEKNAERYKWLADVRDKDMRRPGEAGYDRSTLHIPPREFEKLTPFEKQYWGIKREHFDKVLFFKKGKFYELYENDADIGCQSLALKLTERVNMRMAGVPEGSFHLWASKLLALGYAVCRADEVQTAGELKRAQGKGIVHRELTEILSVGSLVDPRLISSSAAVYICSLQPGSGCVAVECSSSSVLLCPSTLKEERGKSETSSSSISSQQQELDALEGEVETCLLSLKPKEIVIPRESSPTWRARLRAMCPSAVLTLRPLTEFNIDRLQSDMVSQGYFQGAKVLPSCCAQVDEGTLGALAGAAAYLRLLKRDKDVLCTATLRVARLLTDSSSLILDGRTLHHLEVLEDSQGMEGGRGTLWSLFKDRPLTAFGGRLLRQWLCAPLVAPEAIRARQEAVQTLMDQDSFRESARHVLAGMKDVERILASLTAATGMSSIVRRSGTAYAPVVQFLESMEQTVSKMEKSLLAQAGALTEAPQSTTNAIVSLVRSAHACLNLALNTFFENIGGRDVLEAPPEQYRMDRDEQEIREKANDILEEVKGMFSTQTGIRLKDVGKELFQIEIPDKVQKGKVPSSFVLLSQTKSLKRYRTPALSQLAERYAALLDARGHLEEDHRIRLSQALSSCKDLFAKGIDSLAHLDGLLSLCSASMALEEPKCCPTMLAQASGGASVSAVQCRHPGIASLLPSFVSNDIELGTSAAGRVMLLTGPNMGGKSTLLRMVGTLLVLAQLGCWVPAQSFQFSPVDRIFTRLGSGDSLTLGESTFLTEMKDAARFLKAASPRSLLLVDELGRGTSTHDGLAIAEAVVEHLVQAPVPPLTLFATHYSSLIDVFERCPPVQVKHLACQVDHAAARVTFLYRLTPGVCPHSYGLYVAGMAGVPPAVVKRATDIAEQFFGSTTTLGEEISAGVEERSDSLVSNPLLVTAPTPVAYPTLPSWIPTALQTVEAADGVQSPDMATTMSIYVKILEAWNVAKASMAPIHEG